MNRELFKDLVKLMMSTSIRTIDVYKTHSVNLIDYDHDYYNIIDILGESLFSEEGWEFVMQNLYDNINVNLDSINPDILYDELINKGYISE